MADDASDIIMSCACHVQQDIMLLVTSQQDSMSCATRCHDASDTRYHDVSHVSSIMCNKISSTCHISHISHIDIQQEVISNPIHIYWIWSIHIIYWISYIGYDPIYDMEERENIACDLLLYIYMYSRSDPKYVPAFSPKEKVGGWRISVFFADREKRSVNPHKWISSCGICRECHSWLKLVMGPWA